MQNQHSLSYVSIDQSRYVCDTLYTEYDIPENPVLKRLLWQIHRTVTQELRDIDYGWRREYWSDEQIERISIPVDFHIVGITNKLAERDFDQYDEDDLETLRNYWQILCKKHGFVAVEIDKPLWLLHKYWHPAGQEYVHGLLTEMVSPTNYRSATASLLPNWASGDRS